MTIFYAGLQLLPADVIEASALDGATGWQQLRHITIPMMQETFAIVTILMITNVFKIFELVYMLTGGGPVHRSETLVSYMYFVTFTNQQYGYGMAISRDHHDPRRGRLGRLPAALTRTESGMTATMSDQQIRTPAERALSEPAAAGPGAPHPGTARPAPERATSRRRDHAGIAAYLVTFLIVLPILWIALLSFQPSDKILSDPFSFTQLTLDNYARAITSLPLLQMYGNTLLIAHRVGHGRHGDLVHWPRSR